MTNKELIESLEEIMPELIKDGLNDDEIMEYCLSFIVFNKQA